MRAAITACSRDALLNRIEAPAGSLHPIPTDGVNAGCGASPHTSESSRQFYGAQQLSPERPLFDLTLLGLGEDGHTASLIPGTPVLKERSRWVAAVAGVAPEARITLTYPALESSREVAFLVSGAAKREILARIREGSADVPAARIRPVGRLHWFVDRAALVGE